MNKKAEPTEGHAGTPKDDGAQPKKRPAPIIGPPASGGPQHPPPATNGDSSSKHRKRLFHDAPMFWVTLVGVIAVIAYTTVATWQVGVTKHAIQTAHDDAASALSAANLASAAALEKAHDDAVAALNKAHDDAAAALKAANDSGTVQQRQTERALLLAARNADAANAQAAAANKTASLQQSEFERAYPPHIVVQLVEIGNASVTDQKVTLSATFRFTNTGKFQAATAEAHVTLDSLDNIVNAEKYACDPSNTISGIDDRDIKSGKDPRDFKSIRPGVPSQIEFGLEAPISEIRGKPKTFIDSGQTITRPADPWIVPIVVGCITYRSPIDDSIHHTWFMYWVRELASDGGHQFIDGKPHAIPASRVVMTIWPDSGNGED